MKHAHLQVLLWEAADKRAPPDEAADNSKFVWEVRGGVVYPAIHTGSAAQAMRELSRGAGQSRHVSEERVAVSQLKHTTKLFALSDHYILSREWGVFVDQVQTNYHDRLLIVRDPHYGRVCFKSAKTIGALHS